MTITNIERAVWLLILVSLFTAVQAAPAQTPVEAVKYNSATGAIFQPTAGKRPLVAAADVLEYSTDANLALTNAHNTVIWNVPAQALTRTITLPVIGDDPDETAQPVFVYVVDANSDAVEVYDADTNLILSMTAVERSRATFYPVADGGTWIAIDQTFGTAAYVDTGTSGTTLPLNDANITRSGTLTQEGELIMSGGTDLHFDSSSGPFIDGASSSVRAVGTTTNGSTAAMTWADSSLTTKGLINTDGQLVIGNGTVSSGYQLTLNSVDVANGFRVNLTASGVAFYLGQSSANPVIYRMQNHNNILWDTQVNTDNSWVLERQDVEIVGATSAGFRVATSGTGGTYIAKLRTEVGTMASGTLTVTDTAVTSGSIILAMAGFANPGTFEYSISAGASFTITSSDNTDAGSVSWQRIVP